MVNSGLQRLLTFYPFLDPLPTVSSTKMVSLAMFPIVLFLNGSFQQSLGRLKRVLVKTLPLQRSLKVPVLNAAVFRMSESTTALCLRAYGARAANASLLHALIVSWSKVFLA